MTMPGFTAESSFGRTSVRTTRRQSSMANNNGIVPALPLGGWLCVGLAAACRRGSKLACSALANCNYIGQGGGDCYVNDDGSVTCDGGDTFW
jgi:hypothetical protein